MTEQLPQGWVKTTLGDLAEPSRERLSPAEFPDMPYVGLEHIESQTMMLLGHGYARDIRSSSVRFSKGDVIYGKMRPYLNKVWVAEFDGLCSSEFLVFPKMDGLHSLFLALRLNAEDFVAFANEQVSGERPRVNFNKLSRFPILLPPVAEQERIVTKVNAVASGMERALAASRRARDRIHRYRDAVLHSAITGDLSRDWREAEKNNTKRGSETGEALLQRLLEVRRNRWEKTELQRLQAADRVPKDRKWKTRYPEPALPRTANLPPLPNTWAWASIEQVSTRVTVGYVGPMKSEYVASGIPFLRSQNVRMNRFDPEGLLFIRPEFHSRLIKSRLLPGDVVVVRSGLVGTTCVIPESLVEANCSDLVIIQRPLINPHFIAYYMNSAAQADVEAGKVGIALTHFNTASVASLAISLPPIAEQIEIVFQVQRRLSAADVLAENVEQQLSRGRIARESLLREAFAGRLVLQSPKDEPASLALGRIRAEKARRIAEQNEKNRIRRPRKKGRIEVMIEHLSSPEMLIRAWEKIGRKADARRLLNEAGFGADQVVQFYEVLRATPEVRIAFQEAAQRQWPQQKPIKSFGEKPSELKGRFRLVELWLGDFKNLKDYTIRFDPDHAVDIILGWNGTGKSNLFEALIIILRDLHEWWDRNRWPDKPMKGYRLSYEMDEHLVEITWCPEVMKRPELRMGSIPKKPRAVKLDSIKRAQLPLPRFVFGYYSGPTNRLAEHFLPMKQSHYIRLREAKADDAMTLAKLLEQRRFFCAETHHAKYVLLAFSYKEDPKISEFLEDRLRILGFESALFIIRRPRWAKSGSNAEDFWGATGVMRRVMERLRRFAIAPMVLKQTVSYGYRSSTEDHYYFFLPNIESLHSFAAEYQDARTFFLALESTDFSELIHDVQIQVRVKATNVEQVPITFHQLSEGEQQLLMVLGLMRFTKSHQSLVLLDEPDTHINPQWSVKYIKDLTWVMSDNALQSPEQQTSQTLMATHDPLVIASLIKEQIHILKRDPETGICRWTPAGVNPRGLGFTGILTSEMFGFRSDLDQETLDDLDNRVRLIAIDRSLNAREKKELEDIDRRLTAAGFSKAFSDPYYSAFVRAWGRRHSELMAGKESLTAEEKYHIDRIASEVLKEAIAEVEKEAAS
jgi:restriction endonuclease S subunit/predicted ATPase